MKKQNIRIGSMTISLLIVAVLTFTCVALARAASPYDGLIYEAEDDTKTNGCKFKSRKTGFTGTGYMDYGGDGTWIKWKNINISNAGEYTLKFRYSKIGRAHV